MPALAAARPPMADPHVVAAGAGARPVLLRARQAQRARPVVQREPVEVAAVAVVGVVEATLLPWFRTQPACIARTTAEKPGR